MSEEKLIKQCIKNDEKAVFAFFEKYAPFMMGVARRYVSSDFDADDILQEAFIKILSHLYEYDKTKGILKHWIAKIVINESLMFLRRKNKNMHLFIDTELHSMDYYSEYNIGYEQLKQQDLFSLLDKLPDGKRIIFSMYAIDGYKHNEIAEILNISEGTSKSQYAKAKLQLQQEINNLI